MQIEIVDCPSRARDFLEVPRYLYRDDKVWVCPLDMEVEARFDKQKNSYLQDGEAMRWVLRDNENRLAGRIAAFYHRHKSFTGDVPAGGTGFFECIDNQEAAKLLFDTVRQWLESKGLQAMDGPVAPGENESFWGLLVEGFTQPGYGMNYNFPYYRKLFEQYGFRTYFEQYSFHLDVTKPFPDRFWKIADWVARKPGFTFRHFTYGERERFIADMVKVYNEAWSGFKNDFTPMEADALRKTLESAKAILDEELIWFAYHLGEPIAFFVMFPDVNQAIKPFRGKLNLWNAIRLMVYKHSGRINRARALVAGVVPRFQNSGIESAIFSQYNKVIPPRKKYREIELSWVGDFNPKMIAMYEAVGAKKAKTHITYRFLFDNQRPFRRYMPEKAEIKLKTRRGQLS